MLSAPDDSTRTRVELLLKFLTQCLTPTNHGVSTVCGQGLHFITDVQAEVKLCVGASARKTEKSTPDTNLLTL